MIMIMIIIMIIMITTTTTTNSNTHNKYKQYVPAFPSPSWSSAARAGEIRASISGSGFGLSGRPRFSPGDGSGRFRLAHAAEPQEPLFSVTISTYIAGHTYAARGASGQKMPRPNPRAPNLPTNINYLYQDLLTQHFWKFPTDMKIPPLNIKIMLESSPLKSRIVVRRLAVLQ